MKELLAELYNKVVCFFQTEKSDNSKEVAQNRLKLVLMHDRTKLDPLTLEKMRYEIIDVISRYVVIDKELLELNLASEGNSMALMLNIPVVRAKTEEELELEAQESSEEESKEEEETVKEDYDDELDAAIDAEDCEYELPEEAKESEEADSQELETHGAEAIDDLSEPEVGASVDEVVEKEEVAEEIEEKKSKKDRK